ncbi:MAG TPA: class I SAM-dependent DNA methyltransferase, partial [Flavobacteriales bacterium]|nr:class I SAM-dependent DNA methyltransferase [Flavobacteriales bacterium]
MITGTLRNDVDALWEAFWTGGVTNPLTVIEQITYLLFLRRLDEVQTLREKQATKLGGAIKEPVYRPEQRHLRWSSFKDKDPETLFQLFTVPDPKLDNLTAFEFMKRMGQEGSVFATYMKGATFMIPTPKLLDRAVQMIDRIPMADRDTKGDLYEYLLSKIATAGKNGQFRTPRHIIRMMVQLVEPRPDDTICDPAAGTCGFLVEAGEELRRTHPEAFHQKKFLQHYEKDLFTGIEFDSTMVRIGAMNLMLHGIEHPELIDKNALGKGLGHISDRFSLMLANPPFKGSVDHEDVDPNVLKLVKSKKSELLFLGLMLRMLKVGGRAAVIVPDGVLFGSSKAHKQIRQELIENQQLHAVISMPSGVFKPYAGVSTAVLLFTRTDSGGTDQVWFYDMGADGFSLDDKRTPKLSEAEAETQFTDPAGQATALLGKSDIADILSRYGQKSEARRKRTEQSFLVPFAELKANGWDLSMNRYKELVYEPVDYPSPEELINGTPEQPGLKQLAKERLQLLLEDLGLEKLAQ